MPFLMDDHCARQYKTGGRFAPSATVCAYLHADNQVNAGMAGRKSCISVFCAVDCYFYTERNEIIIVRAVLLSIKVKRLAMSAEKHVVYGTEDLLMSLCNSVVRV